MICNMGNTEGAETAARPDFRGGAVAEQAKGDKSVLGTERKAALSAAKLSGSGIHCETKAEKRNGKGAACPETKGYVYRPARKLTAETAGVFSGQSEKRLPVIGRKGICPEPKLAGILAQGELGGNGHGALEMSGGDVGAIPGDAVDAPVGGIAEGLCCVA